MSHDALPHAVRNTLPSVSIILSHLHHTSEGSGLFKIPQVSLEDIILLLLHGLKQSQRLNLKILKMKSR